MAPDIAQRVQILLNRKKRLEDDMKAVSNDYQFSLGLFAVSTNKINAEVTQRLGRKLDQLRLQLIQELKDDIKAIDEEIESL